MPDTAEGLLRELATHLQHDASLNRERFPGRRVGALVLSNEEGALWNRIVRFLGGEPNLFRDVEVPAIKRILAEGR